MGFPAGMSSLREKHLKAAFKYGQSADSGLLSRPVPLRSSAGPQRCNCGVLWWAWLGATFLSPVGLGWVTASFAHLHHLQDCMTSQADRWRSIRVPPVMLKPCHCQADDGHSLSPRKLCWALKRGEVLRLSTSNSVPGKCSILEMKCGWVNSDLINLKTMCAVMDTKIFSLLNCCRTRALLFRLVVWRWIILTGWVHPANHSIMYFLKDNLYNSVWKRKNEWSANRLIVSSGFSCRTIAAFSSVPLFLFGLEFQPLNDYILWASGWHGLHSDTVLSAKINSDKEIKVCLFEMLRVAQS